MISLEDVCVTWSETRAGLVRLDVGEGLDQTVADRSKGREGTHGHEGPSGEIEEHRKADPEGQVNRAEEDRPAPAQAGSGAVSDLATGLSPPVTSSRTRWSRCVRPYSSLTLMSTRWVPAGRSPGSRDVQIWLDGSAFTQDFFEAWLRLKTCSTNGSGRRVRVSVKAGPLPMRAVTCVLGPPSNTFTTRFVAAAASAGTGEPRSCATR